MKTIRLALMSLAAAFGVLVASGQQAQVVSLLGSATVLKPGAAEAVPLAIGDALPEGSVVTTGKGASALIESHSGVQTGLGSESSVAVGVHSVSADGVRTAVIDLKSGTTVSVLDPAKRAVNNYAIRTPKGVAAARGTTYTTMVELSSGGQAMVTVNTLTGTVVLALPNGTIFTLNSGSSVNTRSSVVMSLAQAVRSAGDPKQKQDTLEAIEAAVKVVAIIAQAAPQVGDNPGQAQTTLASVTRIVTQTANEVARTDPDTAKTMVSSTVIAVRTFAGTSGVSAVNQVRNTVTEPALQEAVVAAVVAPVTPQAVVVQPSTTSTTQQTITAPSNTSTPTNPQPDITIIVSPSSTSTSGQ